MAMVKNLSALVPTPITDAMVNAFAAEDSSTVWAAYSATAGDIRHVVATHRRYKAAATFASTVSPELEPDKWKDIGPTNKWAMFDGYVSTPTLLPSGTPIILTPGYFNAILLRGVSNANGLTVTVKSSTGGPVIFGPYTDDMEGSEPGDWYEYWYMPFSPKERVLITGIEPYANAEVTITLTSASGDVSIGMLAVGDLMPLASTLVNPEARFSDFSYVDIDSETGENVIEKGANARDLALTGWIPSEEASGLDRAMRALLGVPAEWIASTEDRFEGLTTFGLGRGSIRYPDRVQALLNLEVQGLI